jgi:hypothetical protein
MLWSLHTTSWSQSRSYRNCPSFEPQVPWKLSQFQTLGLTGSVSISDPQFPIHKCQSKSSKVLSHSTLACLLQNVQTLLFTKTIKPKWLTLYCKSIWHPYKLDNNDRALSISKVSTISKPSNALGHGQWFPYIQASVRLQVVQVEQLTAKVANRHLGFKWEWRHWGSIKGLWLLTSLTWLMFMLACV